MKGPLAATVLYLVASVVSQSARNVSVDDQDPSITYLPSRASWTLTAPGDWDAGADRAHMLASDANAVATFTFTGVDFYYWAAMWPYAVLSTVTIDEASTLVNLTDPDPPATAGLPPTKKSSIVFSATGLANTTHTVRVSVGTATDGNYAIVDLFTYTTYDTPTQSSGTTGTATNTGKSTRTGTSSSDSASNKGLSTAIKIGIAVAIVGLFLLLLVIFLILRWLRRRREEEQPNASGYYSPDPNLSSGSNMRSAHSPVPMETSPMWSDPDYLEATRRMNVPVGFPYANNGSRSSVRLVPPEGPEARMISDGSNYSSASFPSAPGTNAQPPYDPYAPAIPSYGSRQR